MKHASQTEFWRPVEVVLPPDHGSCIDKWQALNALTDAAEQFELTHRTLGVLKALMTFLPDRLIHPEPGRAIVFPSNKTLAHRLNGMPDSTLRRHLARLVTLGIVSRHDSPNRKRYARRAGGAELAFGFDLSPIARHADQLQAAAERAREAREALALLRARLGTLRHRLLECEGLSSVTEDARIALRRKPDQARLTELSDRLQARLEEVELSNADAQNERHIQAGYKYISDSKGGSKNALATKKRNEEYPSDEPHETTKPISLQEVTARCREYQSYFPDRITSWLDVVLIASRLAHMLGIEREVFDEACRNLGQESAAIVVLCLLENAGRIKNPGGYLRQLSKDGRAGGVNLRALMPSVGEIVS
ncbi:plasmid replication protein RepC [Litoreibacter ponti]|nr:plasmid replication protein RepC [Litoreibacter ponti]